MGHCRIKGGTDKATVKQISARQVKCDPNEKGSAKKKKVSKLKPEKKKLPKKTLLFDSMVGSKKPGSLFFLLNQDCISAITTGSWLLRPWRKGRLTAFFELVM